jgi:undecaprenyl-diphosphatase
MFAATAYSVLLKDWNKGDAMHLDPVKGAGPHIARKGYEMITESRDHTIAFIIGNVMAFVVAILAIRFFINYLKVYGFKVFGWYRIIAGIILLALILTGYLPR